MPGERTSLLASLGSLGSLVSLGSLASLASEEGCWGEKYEGVVAGVAAGEGWVVVVVGVRATG